MHMERNKRGTSWSLACLPYWRNATVTDLSNESRTVTRVTYSVTCRHLAYKTPSRSHGLDSNGYSVLIADVLLSKAMLYTALNYSKRT